MHPTRSRAPRRRAVVAVAAAAVAVAAVAAGCSNRQPPRYKGPQPHLTVHASAGADGVQRVDIDATDADRFFPDTVVVHPGKVELVVHNDGVIPHTLEIPTLGVDTGNVGKHQVKSVTFTVRRTGTYPFDCAYHVTLHMDGTLKVVPG